MHYHQTTYPSSPQLTYDMTTDYNKTDGHSPITRNLTRHNSRKSAFAQTTIPTNIHTANIIFTNIILMADTHTIPKDKMHSNFRLFPEHIVCKITQRNNIRRANTCDQALKLLNEEITSNIEKHKQNIWKEHLDAHWDHRQNTHILWKTIHGLSNIAPPHTLNTSITFNNKIATTPKHIANYFNQMAPPARTITVALDMSKTFDTINKYTLIRKLLQTNIQGTIIRFIAYIKGRKAYTTYRNHDIESDGHHQ